MLTPSPVGTEAVCTCDILGHKASVPMTKTYVPSRRCSVSMAYLMPCCKRNRAIERKGVTGKERALKQHQS